MSKRERELGLAGHTLVAVSIAVAGTANAQDKSEPAAQYKPPAQQVQQVQKKEKTDDADKPKDAGQDPAGAITPSDLKQRRPEVRRQLPAVQGKQPVAGEPELVRAVPAGAAPGSTVRLQGRNLGPDQGDRGVYLLVDGRGYSMGVRSWSDGEIVAVVPSDAELGPAVIRLVPRSRDVVLSEIDFEVVSPVAGSDALPDDAGRPDLPGPGERGGFTPPAGGYVAGCDGPDPTVDLEISHWGRNDDGTYMLHVHAIVTNAGRQAYMSGPNQQSAVIRQGRRALERITWGPDVESGATATTFIAVVDDWIPNSEFSAGYEAEILYDPDIAIDGNPDNDDCNPNNNKATLAPDEIARHVGAR